jgi:excisionase family DNA binding protein
MERISELLTVREAAELLRLREASVYQKGAAGELAVVKLGRGPTSFVELRWRDEARALAADS